MCEHSGGKTHGVCFLMLDVTSVFLQYAVHTTQYGFLPNVIPSILNCHFLLAHEYASTNETLKKVLDSIFGEFMLL